MFRCHPTNEPPFVIRSSSDSISLDASRDFISQQFANEWALSKTQSSFVLECCSSIAIIDFRVFIDSDANEVWEGWILNVIAVDKENFDDLKSSKAFPSFIKLSKIHEAKADSTTFIDSVNDLLCFHYDDD